MRLTNKTKWNTGDLRKLILETIERSGYEERESKLKRLQNQLRKLYRKKKYYEKSK